MLMGPWNPWSLETLEMCGGTALGGCKHNMLVTSGAMCGGTALDALLGA